MRTSTIKRDTTETNITLSLNLDGKGIYKINTGVGFFNHMLELFSKHSLIDLEIFGKGDLHVDYHHIVEDTGICLGKGIIEALGDKKGINRYGYSCIPLDEAVSECIIDISGRPYYQSNLTNYDGLIKDFDFELGNVFFSAFASMGFTLHINVKSGNNLHHILESSVKALARAVRMACEIDERIKNEIPSTKNYIQK